MFYWLNAQSQLKSFPAWHHRHTRRCRRCQLNSDSLAHDVLLAATHVCMDRKFIQDARLLSAKLSQQTVSSYQLSICMRSAYNIQVVSTFSQAPEEPDVVSDVVWHGVVQWFQHAQHIV